MILANEQILWAFAVSLMFGIGIQVIKEVMKT